MPWRVWPDQRPEGGEQLSVLGGRGASRGTCFRRGTAQDRGGGWMGWWEVTRSSSALEEGRAERPQRTPASCAVAQFLLQGWAGLILEG